MQSRSYNFSTARKRSTMIESKGIQFPRQDQHAPRMRIFKKQCPPQYQSYMSCLQTNSSRPQVCLNLKQKLFQCGKQGIKKANTDKNYQY